jgi:hypothetical protein
MLWMRPEAFLHAPNRDCQYVAFRLMAVHQSNSLELLDTIDAFWLLLAENKTAEGSFEVLSTRPVCHAIQTRAIPVDFTSFFIESTLTSGLLFQILGRSRNCAFVLYCPTILLNILRILRRRGCRFCLLAASDRFQCQDGLRFTLSSYR